VSGEDDLSGNSSSQVTTASYVTTSPSQSALPSNSTSSSTAPVVLPSSSSLHSVTDPMPSPSLSSSLSRLVSQLSRSRSTSRKRLPKPQPVVQSPVSLRTRASLKRTASLDDLHKAEGEATSPEPNRNVPTDNSLRALRAEVKKRSEKRGKLSSPIENK
jgi:hypothetical protein